MVKILILLVLVALITGVYLYYRHMLETDPYDAITYWNPILDRFTKNVNPYEYPQWNSLIDDLMINQDTIRQEYERVMASSVPVANLNKYERQLAGDDGKWRMIPVKFLNSWFPHPTDQLVVTRFILKKYENDISSAFFSILEPGKVIPFHEGPYKGIYRLQVPIIIPKVKKSSKTFEEPPLGLYGRDPYDSQDKLYDWSEPFIFDDTFQHKAWNLTDQPRVILLIELRKPLTNWFVDKLNRHFVSIATTYAKGLSLND